jgi:hypothetical protein
MRFRYSTTHAFQRVSDALPRVEIDLDANSQTTRVLGLVDSGSTINVMPYQVGLDLGYVWDDRKATIGMSGSLAAMRAVPVSADGALGDFDVVKLIFAWVRSDEIPLIFGQTNFFVEYEVHFYRAQYEFEVFPRKR